MAFIASKTEGVYEYYEFTGEYHAFVRLWTRELEDVSSQ